MFNRTKKAHCLFVEEETYKWAPSKSRTSKSLVAMAILLIAITFIFATLR